MSWWSDFIGGGSKPAESRSTSLENPSVSLDDSRAWANLFGSSASYSGEAVTVEAALGIPAVFAAVDAISSTIKSLPVHLYRKTPDGGREKVSDADPLQRMLRDQVNSDYLTTSDWLGYVATQYLTRGRSLTFIERNRAGRATNLWPLDVDRVTVKVRGHRRQYVERVDGGSDRVYDAGEIIDLIWMPGSTIGFHLDPIQLHRNTFGAIIAADKFAQRAFRNGGISPLKLSVPATMSPAAAQKAVEGVSGALSNGGMVLPVFGDMDLAPVGFDAKAMQMLELKRFQVEEVARIFRIQPSKIQDHTRSTFSNSEQQGLAFVKDTIAPFVEQIEAELLVKLFSDKNRSHFVKFNLDSLTRGDLAARYAAFNTATGGAGFLTANEVRAIEDREPLEGGDKLMIQGALLPADQAGAFAAQSANPTPEPDPEPAQDETGDE